MSDLTQAIKIFDKEFKFKCPKRELTQLHMAALKLENKMKIIRNNNTSASMESIIITAALNIIAEYQSEADEITVRLNNLKDKLVSNNNV
jgi:cell division protein ZapA (FtsZ GTPase activity inhibitor)